MKMKMMVLLLSGAMAVALSGCSKAPAGETAATKAGNETMTETAASGETTPGDTVKTDGNDETSASDERGGNNGEVSANGGVDAKAFVEILCNGDTSELMDKFTYTDTLLTAMEAQGGLEGLQTSLKQLGALKAAAEPIVTEINGYTSYSVPCQFDAQNLNIVINVDSDNQIAGIVTAEYDEGIVETVELPEGATETALSIPVKDHQGWELPGTLTLPAGDGPFPVVILVHGSGASDRDETIFRNKPFRDLAYGLAEQGIAVYRYDKRTYVYGQELSQDTTLTLNEETVIDAAQAVALLKGQDKIDPSRIFVLGHSLGGQALPRINEMLTADGNTAAGYIFLAAPARKLSVIMREQYDFLYTLTPQLTEEQQAQKDAIYAQLDQLDNAAALSDTEAIMGAYGTYWKDLDAYDAVAVAADMTKPCLVLQGEEDYQVSMEDFGLWKDTYGNAGNWQFKSYPGLTHMFMAGQKANGSADYQKAQQVDPAVIGDITAFVEGK